MENSVLVRKYPCFIYADDTCTLCRPLFLYSPINMFGYLRIYKDDSIFTLSTYPQFDDYYFNNLKGEALVDFSVFEMGANSLLFTKKSGNRKAWLVSEIWQSQYWHSLYEGFNISSYLCVFEKISDYYEAFYFASRSGENILSFYLNHYDTLENFMMYFKEAGANLIKDAQRCKIILPPRNLEYMNELRKLQEKIAIDKRNFSNLGNKLKLKRYPIYYGDQYFYVTCRELECLRCLAAEYTVKESGKILHISPRTVETHLQHMKDRLGINSLSQLLVVYRSSSLTNSL